MVREINVVYLRDYDHPELLHGFVEKYHGMQKGGAFTPRPLSEA